MTKRTAITQVLADLEELRYAVFGNPLKVTQEAPFDRASILCRLDRLEEEHYAQRSRLGQELARVFGAPVTDDLHHGFAVEGWPDRIQYVPALALPVLRDFATGHGSTEDGDAEVCSALERAGAVVEVRP